MSMFISKTYVLGLCYKIQVYLKYVTNNDWYPFPDNPKCYFTQQDVPPVPGIPYITKRDRQLAVEWHQPSNEEGLSYQLQQKRENNESEAWTNIYSDKRNFYIITSVPSRDINGSIYYRVRAKNKYGYSDFSNASVGFDVHQIADSLSQPLNSSGLITVSTICAALIAFLILILVILYFIHKNRNLTQKKKPHLNQISPLSPDLELANIRELPLSPGFIDASNPMYRMYQTPTDEELEIIPKIKRCQITLTKFLGSGAFGEVYEGQVQELNSEDGESVKIAVKTLRKGRIVI